MGKKIPIIDLFAGPGGLGEGFSSLKDKQGKPLFQILLSIEKDKFAHQTLSLRAFYRQFKTGSVPQEYYSYLKKEITREELFKKYPEASAAALKEAQLLELGKDDVTSIVSDKLNGNQDWLLIGGPPCQAYSLVGRSRMLGIAKKDGESEKSYSKRLQNIYNEFQDDVRHKLYKEYLKIIADHSPRAFVMENVKGILSAKHNNELIFPKILNDLKFPNKALEREGRGDEYEIRSFTVNNGTLKPIDYLIKSEDYGIPQRRHRVILLGIRKNKARPTRILEKKEPLKLELILKDLPKLTSGLSRKSDLSPYESLEELIKQDWWIGFTKKNSALAALMKKEMKRTLKNETRGSIVMPKVHANIEIDWYTKGGLQNDVYNHETRGHMKEDLWRYFFCACFAKLNKNKAPHLRDFPEELLPKHKNVTEGVSGNKFGDRFRVQVANSAATTITSHISKDGHYFIHYDPTQNRSLTVREAARIQTFPDDYFFEGPRTAQFHQVGNAVPPLLAYKLAKIVKNIF